MLSEAHLQIKFGFKALADDTRIRMIGLLAGQEYNVQQLASLLGVREPTVSHHLSKLRAVGFVLLRMDGNQRFYRLNHESLDRFKQAVLNIEELAPTMPQPGDESWIDQLPFDEDEKKLLRDNTYAGRLRQIPAKQNKKLVIYKWLVRQFEPGVTYSEREVNDIIVRFHDDYASLRRGLIEFGFLRRERGGGQYWVTPDDE